MATFDEGISETIALFRVHGEMTRSQLVELSGLSRTTVNQRLEASLNAGLIVGDQGGVHTKGRPADRFSFDVGRGWILAAEMGATMARVGLCDLAGGIARERDIEVNLSLAPEEVMSQLTEAFDALLAEQGAAVADVCGIGVSVPAPVKVGAGFSVSPPIMPSWNRFDVPAWLSGHYSAPAVLEKDANVMAYGEWRFQYPDVGNLMMVKVGTGIGSGFVLEGKLFRGADGAAGDLGHTLVETLSPDDGPLCKCGNRGCLEAYAGGWAIMRDLAATGDPRYQDIDLAALITQGDPLALERIRAAGRLIGSAIATAINLLNPRVVVIGGRIADAGGDHLFAGIREMVYRRSLPLATSNLRIERSSLYPRSGLMGLASLVIDSVLSPERIGALLAERVNEPKA